MPKYQVEMNGQRFEIDAPDDASVNLAVKQLHEQAQPSAADRIDSNLNSSASGFVSGIPIVGPALNEGLNRAEAGVRTLWDGDKTYQQELDGVHQKEKTDVAANPGTHTAAGIAGGMYGTAPAMMAAPAAFGIGTGSVFGRMALSGATGSGIGAVDAAARTGADPKATVKGGLLGMGAGIAGPAVGNLVGAGVRLARGATDDVLSALSRPAQRYVEGQLGDAGKVATQRQSLSNLGDNAMLADVSPEWQGVARGAASLPGTREAIVNPLTDRAMAANGRIRSDMNANLGQARIPSQIERGIEGSMDDVSRGYGPVMGNARAVDTQPLADSANSEANCPLIPK